MKNAAVSFLLVLVTSTVATSSPGGENLHWVERVSQVKQPPARAPQMVYDKARSVCVLFGGSQNSGGGGWGETWGWDGTEWTLLLAEDSTGVSAPSPRGSNGMAYDAGRNVVVLFGGSDTSGKRDDTWEWDGTTWMEHEVVGPSPRSQHAMAYDNQRHAVVLFGGSIMGGVSNETWEWDGAQWTLRASSGPAARGMFAMAYDPARGVTVLFGGSDGSQVFDDTWEWDGVSWTERTVVGPSARRGARMAYDTTHEKTVLFCGNDIPQGNFGTFFNDTWHWDGSVWRQIYPDGPMVARHSSGMAFDESRSVLVVAGGSVSGDQGIDDTWELVDTAIPAVSEWGLAVLSLLVLCAGSVILLRSRAMVNVE